MTRRALNILDPRALVLGAAAITPSILATAVTGYEHFAWGEVIAMTALIASERSGLAPFGVALQGLVIVIGVALLLAVASQPALSAASVAALAGGCFIVTARGERLRSLSAFTFIPILYVGFEAREAGANAIGLTIRSVAAVTTLSVVPAILVAAVRHYRARTGAYARHMARVMRWSDHGVREPVMRGVIAVMLGTGAATIAAARLHLPHGQWAVWSAASVITAAAVVRKLRDRITGALVGVPLGIAAGLMLPANTIVAGAATAVGLLTLIAIRPYRLAFATRCGCVAVALVASHHSGLSAAERAEGIVLGGVIGLAAFALTGLALPSRLCSRNSSLPAPVPSDKTAFADPALDTQPSLPTPSFPAKEQSRA